MNLSTLELPQAFIRCRNPRIFIAVNEGSVFRPLKRAAATNEQTGIFVFAVGQTDRAVLFNESARKELAFGGLDEFAEFVGLHSFC